MSKSIFKLQASQDLPLAEVTDYFQSKMGGGLVTAVGYELGAVQTALYVYERSYLRTEGVATLSVFFTKDEHRFLADVVASGAGMVTINISFGANAHCANLAANILKELGFEEI